MLESLSENKKEEIIQGVKTIWNQLLKKKSASIFIFEREINDLLDQYSAQMHLFPEQSLERVEASIRDVLDDPYGNINKFAQEISNVLSDWNK